MSKLTKFFKHPVMFFEDAQKNKKLKEGKPKIFVVGFSTWKTYLRMYFSEYDLVFLPKDIKKSQFNSQYRKKILSLKDSCQVFIWGFKAPEYILEFLREEKVSTKFVEDGFVRSVQLGATKAPPMSLCLDSKTPYFDATRPSELEDLLNNFDFSSKPELIVQAKEGIKLLLKTGVSKYNNSKSIKVEKIYGPKANKRILVLGQVEDDASIQYGCDKKLTNNDVVRLAVEENPGAQVIYKPHPDVLNGHRPYQSDPSDVENIALVLKRDIPLANAFETIDHVYTITSLGGFEALLRGIKVTTLGCPFYSGWGLTDERQSNSRRNRTLTLEQLFAVSYLVYPTYYNSTTGDRLGFDEVVWLINKSAANSASVIQAKQSAKAMSEDKKKITSSLMVNVSAGSKVNKRGFLIGFGMHKIKFYADQITEYNCWALNMPVSKQAALSVSQIMSACSPNEGDAFIIWGKKEPVGLEAQAYSLGIDVIRIEDAFIRSIGLGGHHATPLSYIYDKSGIYFDASKPSELEHILSGYDFQSNTELMEKARYTIDRMLENKTSKYNYAKDVAIEDLYGPK
ncbi:capsular polysaccharide export protein, LipB/KpsS family, partial [Halomonas sp. GFAJ-1]|uniref:capsular polysaccharide export protein, LipB/KpsS family n=1 Tax=Halomonas sp. GFAJ-1 TaxID=1118153 RepID=UPI00023A1B6C